MITKTYDRVWKLSDDALAEMLNRVEADDITAEEAIAILLEVATVTNDEEED